jgi:hypothetical protein
LQDLDNVNPDLDPNGLQNNGGPTQTIAIVSKSSPAIGHGINPLGLATDQRGFIPPARVWDIGAYQYNAVPPPSPSAAPSAAGVTNFPPGAITASPTVGLRLQVPGRSVVSAINRDAGNPVAAGSPSAITTGPALFGKSKPVLAFYRQAGAGNWYDPGDQ